MRAAYLVQGIGYFLLLGALIYIAVNDSPNEGDEAQPHSDSPVTSVTETSMSEMTLRSPAFGQGELIPTKYTCDGENTSPPLAIDGIPMNAASLALIVEDPDVPTTIRADGMWDHWVVFNIPPDTEHIPEGTQPRGIAAIGTTGMTTYGGPCPPNSEHRYFFRVYALDTLLSLPEGASKQDVLRAMEGHVLTQAELVGRYVRVTSSDQ